MTKKIFLVIKFRIVFRATPERRNALINESTNTAQSKTLAQALNSRHGWPNIINIDMVYHCCCAQWLDSGFSLCLLCLSEKNANHHHHHYPNPFISSTILASCFACLLIYYLLHPIRNPRYA